MTSPCSVTRDETVRLPGSAKHCMAAAALMLWRFISVHVKDIEPATTGLMDTNVVKDTSPASNSIEKERRNTTPIICDLVDDIMLPDKELETDLYAKKDSICSFPFLFMYFHRFFTYSLQTWFTTLSCSFRYPIIVLTLLYMYKVWRYFRDAIMNMSTWLVRSIITTQTAKTFGTMSNRFQTNYGLVYLRIYASLDFHQLKLISPSATCMRR